MSRPRLVVLISGNGSNLQAIIDQVNTGTIAGDIALVVSNKPDAYGLVRAETHGISNVCLSHKDFASREDYDEALIDVIDKTNPDFIVLAGFMRILTPAFVEHYAGKMVNIHPSLLPKYKGLNTHQRAIDAGDTEHGVSVHFVTPELDGGPVIIQSKVPVFEQDDAQELAKRVQAQEQTLYPLVVKWLCEKRLAMHNNRAIFDNETLPQQGYAND